MDYAKIFEASLNEIYIFDASTLKFIEVNRGARENLGYTLDELCQMTPLDLKLDYTAETFAALVAPLRDKSSEKIEFTTTHRRKDGSFYPVEVHLQLMEQDGCDVFVAIILDISEQQRLSSIEDELGNIFQQSLNEIYVFDQITMQFIEVNTGARQNLGYTIDELRTMTPLDFKPLYTAETFAALVQPLRDGSRELVVFETIHRRKDGTEYPVEVHLQNATLYDRPVFLAMILDQTEKNRLTERNRNLGQIFDHSLNEIYIFDAVTLQFKEVNTGARTNLGYSQQEMLSMTPFDLITGITADDFFEMVAPLASGTIEIIDFEAEHRRKDGTTYPTEVHLQRMSLADHDVFVAIVLDITERRLANQQLLNYSIQAQQAELVKNFIRDTSHEFRSSLAILNTKSYLLNRTVDESLHRHTAAIQEHVDRLDKLVSGLQETAVLQATEEIITSPLKINTVLNYIASELRHLTHQKNLTVHIQLAESLPEIMGDQTMIQTALYHIYKNACEYNVEEGEIIVSTTLRDGQIIVTIEDTGVGIDHDECHKIFEPLYRVDQARSLKGGHGLGLTIARRIVTLHGGDISVQSMPSEGSRFNLTFPVNRHTMPV